MKVWLNTRLVDARRASVSVFDHGFLYGDGIYETVHAYQGHVFHWPLHYKRLLQSARAIELHCPWSSAWLRGRIERVLKTNRKPNASVRITVARGPGSLGLNPKLCPKSTLVLLLHPDRDMRATQTYGVTIGITAVRRNHPLCLDPQIKSNNSLNTILAKMEAERMHAFEGVLTNLDGYLTEGTISNLFFIKGNVLYTPAVSCGLLEGVTRGAVIQIAKRAGLNVHQGRYTPEQLVKANECFLSSTTLEIVPVVGVKRTGITRRWRIGSGRPGPVTHRLQNLFRNQVEKELKR